MKVLAQIGKKSEQVGLVPTILCAIAWLVLSTFGARAVAFALGDHPRLAYLTALPFAVIGGLGGLVSFWLIADHLDFRRRGYRVRCVKGNEWLYEERTSGSITRCVPCVRVILGKRYPAPSEIRILSEAAWEAEAPSWARGRRSEITRRIAQCFGADRGGHVRFADA